MTSASFGGKRRAACAAVMAALLALAACGGGGSSGSDPAGSGETGAGGSPGGGTPPAPPPPSPPAPLALLDSTPADRSGDIARSVQPAFTFSAPVDSASLSAATVELTEVPGTAVPVTLAASGATMSIAPAKALWPDAEYRIDVQGIAGSGGEALAGPITTRFVTRDGQWSAAPVTAMSNVSSFDSESHRLAVAPDGSAVAVWRLPDGANAWRLWASRRSTTGQWSAALEVGASAPGDFGAPALVMAPDGTAHAVWHSTLGIGARQQVFASRLGPADAAWSAPVQLSDGTVVINNDPVLGVGAGGAVYAAWVGGNTNPYDILLVRRLADGSWSAPIVANEPNQTSGRSTFGPALAVHGDGRAVLAWLEADGNSSAIGLKARNYRPDIAAPEPLGPAVDVGGTGTAGSRVMRYRLALNASGDGAIAWEIDGGPQRTVWATIKSAFFEPGWGSSTALDAEATDDYFPQLAVDDAGNVIAMWQGAEPAGPLTRIFSRHFDRSLALRTAGSPWSDLRELSNFGSGLAALAADARGNALVLFSTMTADVMSVRFTRRQGWQPPVVVTTLAMPGTIFEPRVAFDGSGSAVAVWVESDVVPQAAAPSEGFAVGGARFD